MPHVAFYIDMSEPVQMTKVPSTLIWREVSGMLFRYIVSNVGYWSDKVVAPLLRILRDEVNARIRTRDLEGITIDELVALRKKLNGILRWLTRQPRKTALLKLMPLLRRQQQRAILHQDLNCGEFAFGLTKLPVTDPLSNLHTFNATFGCCDNSLKSLEENLDGFTVKMETVED